MLKGISLFSFILSVLLNSAVTFSLSTGIPSKDFVYIDPLPEAKYVSNETSIIIKPGSGIDIRSLRHDSFKITGSLSGEHVFDLTWSSDNSTLIIEPEISFCYGETVTVDFTAKTRYSNGSAIRPFSFSFTVQADKIPFDPSWSFENEFTKEEIDKMLNGNSTTGSVSDFPQITVTYSNNPSPGSIFLSNIKFASPVPNTPYLIILDNGGVPVFSREMIQQNFDFKKQPSGILTYYDNSKYKYYSLDSSYSKIDSYYVGNGYLTDQHDLKVLANGHALLMSYDKEHVDMSLIVPGGDPNAIVTGLIIQEIDENKNVVFQWRSWDHYLITDATHENFTAGLIDYVHGNAICLDNDGRILVSARHMDEITKIDRSTGNMIWRLGGKNNQFAFPNDPNKFSHQHDINRVSNGNITLFDNGNYHTPQISRAVEYSIDETNKIATLVWQYRHSPDIYSGAMGNVQRLENGNTLIGWGGGNPTLTEVKPDGTKALELTFVNGIFSYRSFKFPWGNGVTGVTHSNSEIPSSFDLMQNFPNPFNPSTKIRFSIPSTGESSVGVTLTVYNVLGKEITRLIDEPFTAGIYEAEFKNENLPSGIYFYRLTAAGINRKIFEDTKRMILIK